ncbi:hypothetical protein HY642_07445 [Candidatus Woesearchaeota archaeon]|nr:hypothetical protein [Candidatus Woesearchaeota archaeon]
MNRTMALGLLVLILSGCADLTVRQRVSANGETFGSMHLVLNLTQDFMNQQGTRMSYEEFDEYTKKNSCPALIEQFNLTNSTCDVKYLFLTYSGNGTGKNITEADGFVRRTHLLTTEYQLKPNMSGLTSGALDAAKITEARAQGVKATFILEVPGVVQYASSGTILNRSEPGYGAVAFDMLDLLAGGKEISVTSTDYNRTAQIIFSALPLLLIVGVPIVRWLFNRKQKKSLYKDRAGTGLYVTVVLVIVSLLFFTMYSFLFGPAENQLAVFFYAAAMSAIITITVLFYVGTDFEVTQEGIVYKSNFAKKSIRFSEIRKVERAKVVGWLRWWWARQTVTTTSGTTVKPTDFVQHAFRLRNRGVLFQLKNGKSVYYRVRDIDWVIETVKGRIS